MKENLFAKRSLEEIQADSEKEGFRLKRVLGAFDLTFLGIGAIIGTGIFVLTGVAAAKYSGPAVVLSFVVSGFACALAALCYAEFASMIPISGSAYTYAYATLGEIFAWIIGWDLILEYTVSCIAVSIGWSGYMVNLLKGFGVVIPAWACNPPLNLPAAGIVACLTVLLVVGVKESSRFNNIIVMIKLAVILFFIVFGIFYVKPANWTPFMPYGWSGVMSGAAIIFFAYIGFDAVSTTAEEARDPKRDLPIGIIASLLVCTVLYIVVAGILTGIVPLQEINANPEMSRDFLKAPVAFALSFIHQDWASGIISVGAVMGITTVLLVMLFGQPRIFFSMSRDGLLPKGISRVHPRFGTPYITTIITGSLVAIFALLVSIGTVAELTNIGTLFAFAIVSIGVLVLRKTNPDAKRSFKVPFLKVLSPISVGMCVYLMYNLPVMTWIRFLVWLDIGLVIYFFYGHSHSRIITSTDRSSHLTPKYLLHFFGLTVILNAALFGLLSLFTLLGLVAEKSWAEVGLHPHRSFIFCLIWAAMGCVMWTIAGRIKKEV